ncbi:Rieske 2Fe-2S domain-containing protein, partial [Candidatus Uhrbacteria bacterium]|nr:Rieske 2Fe-2S domain-containing protein [Candidatus Uhrbacteria bacterium]
SLVLAVYFFISWRLFPHTNDTTLLVRTAAIGSFVLLNVVLWIGPWSRFSARVRNGYKHRRHLGVVTFFLALLHFAFVFPSQFGSSFANVFLSFFTFFGFTALFIMFWMALTSFDWQQKHIGQARWAKIHLLLFVLYALIAGYAIWINDSHDMPIPPYQWVVMATFFLFWIVVAPWGLIPRLMKYLHGWKQVHVLIHIGFLSLVLHAWLAYVVIAPMWLKTAFILIVSFTWGSHLIGWVIKWREHTRLLKTAERSQQIMIDGKEYWSVGKPEDFVDGRGKKFLIKNLPIAVFRHKEKFFGLFAMCAHQKGPMEKGKIVNGYVECPWHGWQYSCETGQAPPGFHDQLAFYPCVVQEGMVWVSSVPKRAE